MEYCVENSVVPIPILVLEFPPIPQKILASVIIYSPVCELEAMYKFSTDIFSLTEYSD